MPNLPSTAQKNDQMQLTTELLPPHQMFSPTSSAGSSGPSSPVAGPYTPLSSIAAQSFTQQLAGADVPVPEPRQGELELSHDMQLQHDLSSYAWDAGSIWPMGSEILLGDDFDLNAIPGIELGNAKFSDHFAEPASTLQFSHDFAKALEGHEFSHDTMINFDEMMAGQRY